MREIKFRAWNEEIGMSKPFAVWDASGMLKSFIFNTVKHEKYPILMQYTGIKDKNGKEIYEGDVVEISRTITDKEGRKPIREVVEWTGGAILPWPHGEEFEIIGNIYENPELK